jgi:hypothetical protein
MGLLRSLFSGKRGSLVRHVHISKAAKLKEWGARVQPGSNPHYIPKHKRPK